MMARQQSEHPSHPGMHPPTGAGAHRPVRHPQPAWPPAQHAAHAVPRADRAHAHLADDADARPTISKQVVDTLTAAIVSVMDTGGDSSARRSFSLVALLKLGHGATIEAVRVCGHPRLAEERGELVRVYVDCDDAVAGRHDVRLALVPLIRERFVRGGKTELRETPEGFVVLATNPS